MTTKQVLENAVIFLGKEDLLECSYFTGKDEEILQDEQKELDLLLKCLNFIVGEIATDFFPILKQKSVTFINNKFNIKDLDANIFKIIRIENKYGEKVKFNIIDGYLNAKVTDAVITYSAYANKCDLYGNVEDFNCVIPDRVLAYGTAMEYSFVNSLYDDATIWESRYKNSLLALSQKKHNILMPKRRWV